MLGDTRFQLFLDKNGNLCYSIPKRLYLFFILYNCKKLRRSTLMRRRTRKRLDRKVFKATANKSREINLKPVVMRGGIRL